MRTVFIAFVVAFLGLSIYAFHLSQLPQKECHGSSVHGFIDYSADAKGVASPRAAARKYTRGANRLVVERPTEPEMPAYLFRSYDDDDLLSIIEVSRAPVSGWVVTGTETC